MAITISLSGNALIDLNEFKEFAGIELDNPKLTANRLHLWINSASQLIESWCGRKFITPSSDEQEIFDGHGENDYYVKHRRITSTAPVLYLWDGTTYVALSTTTYPIDHKTDTGRVWFTQGSAFSFGSNNYRVDYKYGWTLANIPFDLKMACAQIAFRIMKRLTEGKEGIQSEGFGDSTTTYDYSYLNSEIKMLLAQYRVIGVG